MDTVPNFALPEPFAHGVCRELPSNVGVENALIGTILVHGQEAWDRVKGGLRAEQFFNPTNAEIFEAISHLAAQGRPFSPHHLRDRVYASPSEIVAKAHQALTVLQVDSCVALVSECYTRRQIIEICKNGTAKAYEPGIDDTPLDLTEDLKRELELLQVSDKHADLGIRCWEGADPIEIPPRSWLYGYMLVRREVMMLVARPGAGKTAFTSAATLALAANRPLTGHHVHRRCRVLNLHLEEDDDEYDRRMAGVILHHGVSSEDVRGWIYHRGIGDGLTICREIDGRVITDPVFDRLRDWIREHEIDVVMVDPFVVTYDGSENDNKVQDSVTRLWKRLASETETAVLLNHHVRKGSNTPGDPDAARGGGAQIGTARGVFTLTSMSEQEATSFGIEAKERRRIVRLDDAKRNMAAGEPEKWYRLQSVDLGNATDEYPVGDSVQAVEIWNPPDAFEGLRPHVCREIITAIDAGMEDGERYTISKRSDERWAGKIIMEQAGKSEEQAARILKQWVRNGVLEDRSYHSKQRRQARKGLYANPAKMPGTIHD